MDIPEIKDISVLRLQPDDRLVLRCPNHLTPEAVKRLKEAIQNLWIGPPRPVVILDGGVSLEIVREEPNGK